jgi:2-polyprenyl-3-methyl-5-hydroxy-6-metoxy-1,4-benzoquinol methylase
MTEYSFDSPSMSFMEISNYFACLEIEVISEIEKRINLSEYFQKLSHNARTLRLQTGDLLVGLIFYYENSKYLYVSHLSVLPRFRGLGYGDLMLKRLRNLSELPIQLEVDTENTFARKLYSKNGFFEVESKGTIIVMTSKSVRNYQNEATDNSHRRYRYSADEFVRKYFLQRIEELGLLDVNGKCLEVGSHDGSMTSQLLEYYNALEIIEPVEEFQEHLKGKFRDRVQVHHGLVSDFEFLRKFQSIFLVHVLEHMDNPVSELKQLGSWLRPGGNLFILVPNATALSRQIAVKMGFMQQVEDVLRGEELQGHLRTYQIDTLLRHVEEAGLIATHSGGILRKPLANFQMDAALENGIISEGYLNALNELSKTYPQDSSSIFVVAQSKT